MWAEGALVLEQLGTDGGNRIAITEGARSVTYEYLDQVANRVANGLLAAGLEAGERVAYLGGNSVVCAELFLGCARAGVIISYLNWRLNERELSFVLADYQPRVVIVSDEHALLLSTLPECATIDLVLVAGGPDDDWTGWLALQDDRRPTAPGLEDDVVLQLYTSGTTGRPKGAMLTWAGLAVTMSDLVGLWRLGEDSVALAVLPMFHISGIGSILTTLLARAHLIIGHDLSPAGIAAAIVEHKVTHVVLVTSLLTGIVRVTDDVGGPDLTSLETVSYGGAPISEEVLSTAISRLDCELVQVYGLTETSGALTALIPSDHRSDDQRSCHLARLRSCGRARPGVELRVVATATGALLPHNEIGEIQARSPRIMRGYWNRNADSAEAMLTDGWFRTGDLGHLDSDGYLYLHDRLRDMIISGGENIYPIEVENALQRHPGVLEVAVVGVPHSRWGETPRAVVVPVPGVELSTDELIEFARSRLAHYKCPTSVAIVDRLPRNATGKVLRRELRDPHWAAYPRQVN